MTERRNQTEDERTEALRKAPTGGLPMADDRWRIAAPQWGANYASLRLMDELTLGETEPATLFVWEKGQDERG